MSDKLQELHDDGQKDGANNEYDPPHSSIDFFLAYSEKVHDMAEELKAYDAGYHNARSQKK